MRWLNYHHLFYFWTVAKRGSITDACRELRLSQPTVSAQLKSLEEAVGEPLFVRGGRKLALTEAGQTAFRYAEEIFALGHEFLNVMEGKGLNGSSTLTVGVADVMPKFVAYRLLEPAFRLDPQPRVVVIEGRTDRLLAELALRHLDLVIADSPIPPTVKIKAFNHFLGQCGISFLATEKLAKKYQKGFPQSLSGAPMLLPTDGAAIRRDIDRWFEQREVQPTVVGEFQDSSLMKLVASKGHGIVPVADTVERDLHQQYGLHLVGRTEEIQEKFYLISIERKIKHPAVRELCEKASLRLGSVG